MIDILKKRHRTGDTITIYTIEASITGMIDAFEENCIILSTEAGFEYIAKDTIKRISVSKTTKADEQEFFEKEKTKQEEVNPIKNEEVNTKQIQETLPKTEYKVGDKIPLEELEKLKDKKTKSQFPKTTGKGVVLNSFADEIEAQNKKIVSANGTITKYFGDRNFGFITYMFGHDIGFIFNSIVDESLLQSLRGTVTRANIPVLFTLAKNYKGDSAIHIHKPKLVEQIIELAKQYFEKESKPDRCFSFIQK